LISLPKNPKKYDPYKNRQEFKTRFKIVTTSLLKNKILTNEEYNSIINEKLEFNENHENKLPYVVDYLKGLRNEKSELTNINCHPELVSGSLNCKNPLNDSGSSPE
jgi:membrane peptidoglycan carboxypeptidase